MSEANKLQGRVEMLMDAAEKIIVQYSEPVMEATLHLIWLEGLFYMGLALLSLLIVISFGVLQHKKLGTAWTPCDKGIPCPVFLIHAACLIPGMINVLSFQMWLRIIDPKLYLLHQVIGKVTS